MSKVEEFAETKDGPTTGYIIFCPACQCGHKFDVGRWSFNGDFERPTFSPSMHVTTSPRPKWPQFPVLRDNDKIDALGRIAYVPWEFLRPHENQALKNHGVGLDELAAKGGLTPIEIVAILTGVSWAEALEIPNADGRLAQLVLQWYNVQPDHVCHSFVRDGQIQFCMDSTHELAGKTVDLPDF